MRKIVQFCAIMALAVLAGCGDGTTSTNSKGASAEKTPYSSLATNAVIVSVNGLELTKQDAEQRADLAFALLRVKSHFQGNPRDPQVRALFVRKIVGQFISETLISQAASKDGVVPTKDSIEEARGEIVATFGDNELSFDEFSKKIPKKLREDLDKRIATAAIVYDYIKAKLGDQATVTEKDIDEVMAFAEEKRTESNRLMAEQRAKAAELHKRLLNGEDFATVAKESYTADDDNCDGTWGEFTAAIIESMYPGILKLVTPLKPGEFTAPVEFDEGMYIIQLVSREGSGAPSVFTAQPETLTLKRIVVALPVLYEVGSRAAIKHDLLAERMKRYQKEKLLPSLQQKANILWPNGKISYGSKEKNSKLEARK